MTGQSLVWRPLGVTSGLDSPPDTKPIVPRVNGKIDVLPLGLLKWPDFERLQWRILRDVEGLRHAQLYGEPGQNQLGLDIIAVAADGTGVALQSKKAEKFGVPDIRAAVARFRTTQHPFDVSKFILGVSRPVRRRQAQDAFRELHAELATAPQPVELVLWDAEEISQLLRGAPAIVVEFFGLDVAHEFCDPFEIAPRTVPAPMPRGYGWDWRQHLNGPRERRSCSARLKS